MENVVCIICGKEKFSHYLNVKCRITGEIFKLKECHCSLILTSPRPSKQEIQKYYDNHYFPHSEADGNTNLDSIGWKATASNILFRLFKRFSYKWKSNLIKKNISRKNINLLDIGGGDGSFAKSLKNKINKVHVYEKNQNCINFINANDIFATSNFQELNSNSYNVVTLWHSLEHIHDVEELFNNINRITVQESILIIALPNASASEIKFFSERWVAWDVPRHLYHFTYNSLSLILEKYNWEIIKSKNIIQDTFFNIFMSLEGNFIKKTIFFIFIFLYSSLTQIFFKGKNSSNLVVCQKK